MSYDPPIVVRVFGTPGPSGCPAGRTWEGVARWVGTTLTARFGNQVRTEYVDLLGPETDRFPDIAALITAGTASPPVVTIDGTVLAAGRKISVSAIMKALEAQGLRAGLRSSPSDVDQSGRGGVG